MMTFARSLRSGRDQEVRFELAAQNKLVPNFARRGQPPASIAEGSQDSREARAGATPEGAAVQSAPQGELSLHPSGTRVSGVLGRLSRGRWQLGSADAKPVLRADSKGQLSLQLVKVVRNDLSDSDLELVPSRHRSTTPVQGVEGGSAREATPSLEPALEPEPSRWSRFASRFLGVGSAD